MALELMTVCEFGEIKLEQINHNLAEEQVLQEPFTWRSQYLCHGIFAFIIMSLGTSVFGGVIWSFQCNVVQFVWLELRAKSWFVHVV